MSERKDSTAGDSRPYSMQKSMMMMMIHISGSPQVLSANNCCTNFCDIITGLIHRTAEGKNDRPISKGVVDRLETKKSKLYTTFNPSSDSLWKTSHLAPLSPERISWEACPDWPPAKVHLDTLSTPQQMFRSKVHVSHANSRFDVCVCFPLQKKRRETVREQAKIIFGQITLTLTQKQFESKKREKNCFRWKNKQVNKQLDLIAGRGEPQENKIAREGQRHFETSGECACVCARACVWWGRLCNEPNTSRKHQLQMTPVSVMTLCAWHCSANYQPQIGNSQQRFIRHCVQAHARTHAQITDGRAGPGVPTLLYQ